jgi:hypothetical protein
MSKATKMATYAKVWDENETQTEDKDGRIHLGVVGWVYEVRVGGEYVDHFDSLKKVKRAYPNAIERDIDN